MDTPRWRFPAAEAALPPTGIRVQDLALRFPGDRTPSGGEVRVVYLRDAAEIGEATFALEPGDPDALLSALLPWLEQFLARRAGLPQGSRGEATPAAPKPAPAPERPLGSLG